MGSVKKANKKDFDLLFMQFLVDIKQLLLNNAATVHTEDLT